MRAAPISKAKVESGLLQALEDDDLGEFVEMVQSGLAIDYDFNVENGKEHGYKTILELAIEEDEPVGYVEELIRSGISVNHINRKTGNAPIHTVASEANPDVLRLFFDYDTNLVDPNVKEKAGLSAFDILLSKLIDMGFIESKNLDSDNKEDTSEILEEELESKRNDCMDCILLLLDQKHIRIDLDNPLKPLADKSSIVSSRNTLKKLSNMTPLQVLCSFQVWNAKPISDVLHNRLETIVTEILRLGADTNATGAPNAIPGSIQGSTPAVLLAATRGYYKVIELFKKVPSTNFLLENASKQSILHITLKAGYYNKILKHGDESADLNIKTFFALFDRNCRKLRNQMKGIINRVDSSGNTALHYCKMYPTNEIARLLLKNGAKIHRNHQGILNVDPRSLEAYFNDECVVAKGEDIDDEEFAIHINFKFFEKSPINESVNMSALREKSTAWALDMTVKNLDDKIKVSKNSVNSWTGKVDTKRLEYFSEEESYHYLLKHPVLSTFLEMERDSLRLRYFLDFIVYFFFVISLFIFLSDKYKISTTFTSAKLSGGQYIYHDDEIGFVITYFFVVLAIFLVIIILREIWQLIHTKMGYFKSLENLFEWIVIILVIIHLMPETYFKNLGGHLVLRHLAAICLLIGFFQLYLVFIRITPWSSIPLYISMYKAVLKTYTFILISYLPFILIFAHSFQIIFQPLVSYSNGGNNTIVLAEGDPLFRETIPYALVKTITMFVGEMEYNELKFSHWLGYVIFVLFVFLVMIVLMNILNGLAVSDIHKIREEVDTHYHAAIVETLAHTSFVNLLAEEVILYPNSKPMQQKLFGFPLPGKKKVYKAYGLNHTDIDSKLKEFTFKEETVKAAKDLISQKHNENQSMGRVTLEGLRECVNDVRKNQTNLKSRLGDIEKNIETILDIMKSRQPIVERY